MTFNNSNAKISTRQRTAASVAWSPAAWPTRNEVGPDQRTPNISSLIQEIVNLTGWSEGNSVVIIITGDGERVAESFDGIAGAAPLLHIEYAAVNQDPPSVNAGPDQTITFPAGATLDGTVSDDGLPNPPSLTTTWTQVSGPGIVSFADASAVDTTVSFFDEGTYVLRLTADDGQLTASDEMAITVNPDQSTNLPPTVYAGINQTIRLADNAILDGTVSDDGLPNPPGSLISGWSQVSGPGLVTFADSGVIDTTASFSVPGTYILQLTADDTELTKRDDVTIVVVDNGATNLPPTVDAGSDLTIALPSPVALDAFVTDDGLPSTPGVMMTTWSQVSGPGAVTFDDPASVDTSANFSVAGVYELRLTADDGEIAASDEVIITVNPESVIIRVPDDQPTIQAAIDVALDGDVVLVAPGTYYEQLLLAGKTITLASHFYSTGNHDFIAQTIIDGQGGIGIDVDSTMGPDTKISGFTIQNSIDGIYVDAKLTVENNIISSNNDGVDYKNGGGGLLRNNIFELGTDDGIDINHANDIVIEDNIVRYNEGDGMEIRIHDYIGPTRNIYIRNNLILENLSDGIQIIDYPGQSDRVFHIEGNLFDGNLQVGLGLMDNAESGEDYRAASITDRIHLFNNTFWTIFMPLLAVIT